MKKSISILLLVACALSGCSTFSKSGRQQRAYEKYVRRSSIARVKQRHMFRNGAPQLPPVQQPSEPIESTSTGPEAMTTGEG
jgi:uncharacterized protein YceK